MSTISRRTILVGVPAIGSVAVAASLAVSESAFAAKPAEERKESGQSTKNGQSPIDIRPSDVRRGRDLPRLELDYGVTDLRFEYISKDNSCSARTGEETVEAIVPKGAASASLDGTTYELLQFHFHTRSEHTLNGVSYSAEQHFVHRSEDGRLLVLGLLLNASRRGGPVDAILEKLPEECGPEIELHDIDLSKLVPKDLTVIRYSGSLTTSPFTEGVNWNVIPFPGKASPAGLRRLQKLFPAGNARAVQPLAGRSLTLVRGEDD